ncbi:MFS transporter [Parahaliea maris]|uniref:MFS transporter n=1 Tax=Parahaliea maris TaxID=2716870 RepID=A0A5C9A6T6_9GAMM|nr:MFS transporter [Parahaliea maris]TXS95297.1 MFS transporter [Parahaliea maris]
MSITNKYLVEGIIFLSYVLFAMAWVGGTASMDQIMQSMQLEGLASASFLSGAVTIAKIVGTFIAAWIAVKLGMKNAFLVSAILVGLGIFTPLAQSYDLLLASRFLMGLGGALMVVYFNPIVLRFFSVEERPAVNGLNAVAFNIGTAMILWGMPGINRVTGGWQQSLVWFSVVSLLFAVLWLLVRWQKEESHSVGDASEQDAHYSYTQGLKDSFVWTYALTYAGMLSFYVCLFTFYPKAGIAASKWVIGFGIIGTLAGIIYSRKVLARVPVIRWTGLVQIVCVVILSFSSNELLSIASAMVLGFAVFMPVTALVSIPHELPGMTGQRITVVFSLFWSISYLVATIALWGFGILVDANGGEFTAAFVMVSILSSSFFIGSFFLPEGRTSHQ